MILTETFGAPNALSEINGQRVLDYSYQLSLPEGRRQRFRVNAVGIHSRGQSGVEITLRALPAETPTVAQVGLTTEEVSALLPRDGIVVIAGATGHGKSTTMAALTRHHLETSDRPVKVVDIQAPIEFDYADVTGALRGSASTIGQSEVGRHIRSFQSGVHSALRRKPHVINVGEARDFETIRTSLEASLTGHLVYTTTHAGSVVDAMRRLLSVFPAEEREARSYDLGSALRFLMVQHLVPRADAPGRVPVREYLRFSDRLRSEMLAQPTGAWPDYIYAEMAGRHQASAEDLRRTLREAVRPLYDAGTIARSDAVRLGGAALVAEVDDCRGSRQGEAVSG